MVGKVERRRQAPAKHNTMNHDSDMCFRVGRHFLYLGIVFTVFCLLAGNGSAAVAFWNVDCSFARPKEAALLFGVFWACFAVLGVWIILIYVRSRLYIGPVGVRRVGCFRVRTIHFDGLLGARWRLIPGGGSLVLRGRDGKLTVEFGWFSAADQRAMIRFLRSMIGESIQENWERFQSRLFPGL